MLGDVSTVDDASTGARHRSVRGLRLGDAVVAPVVASARGTVAFLETTGDRHLQLIGGVTAIERRVREVAKAGATRAIVAAPPVELPRPLPIPVEFVAPGTPPPDGARASSAPT